MFYVGANGKYPLVCGDNSGHHLYLNVEGRATTDLTFIINELQVTTERVDTTRVISIIVMSGEALHLSGQVRGARDGA